MPPSTSYQPAPLPRRHGDPAWQERFAWDAASNPVTVDSAPTPNGPGYVRHNRLMMFQDQRYAYDTLGRLSTKRIGKHMEQEFSWNEENQLTEVRTSRNGSSQTVRFEYDALGRRIAKHNEFGSVYFIWEGLRLLQERHARRITTHVYEPDSYVPLARIDTSDVPEASETPPRIYWVHANASGAPEELSDQEGRIHWRARYRAWGNLALHETPAIADDRSAQPQFGEQALRLQGQYFDSEIGLCYNTFRYYDPDCGRFVSQDPIGLLGGLNLYQYGPNPLGWVDPWGWSPCGTSGPSAKFKRWKIGDTINKPMPDGTNPLWKTVRSRYWKNRANSAASGEFSQSNIQRMKSGSVPLDGNRNPMELHHHNPQRNGGPDVNNPGNLREVTREQHAALDPHRVL